MPPTPVDSNHRCEHIIIGSHCSVQLGLWHRPVVHATSPVGLLLMAGACYLATLTARNLLGLWVDLMTFFGN